MKLPAYLSLLGALCLAGCGDSQSTPSKTTATNNTASGNPLTAPVDYLDALGKSRNTAVKVLDTAAVNQAVQLFNAQEGRFPKDLNELVTSGLIARVPDAPPGMKLSYDAATGTVKVVNK